MEPNASRGGGIALRDGYAIGTFGAQHAVVISVQQNLKTQQIVVLFTAYTIERQVLRAEIGVNLQAGEFIVDQTRIQANPVFFN